jgi:hypothetical protein
VRRLKNVPAWGWLALAAALRVAFALKLGDRFYQADESSFENVAWTWASTGVFGAGGRAAVTGPLPCFFFGLFYLFGRRMVLPRLGQAFVGAATAGAIGGMTTDLSGSRDAGKKALALSSVYPFFIYYSGMLLSETLYIFFIVPALWCLCRSLRAREADLASAGAAGFLLGLAGLCRTEAVPIALLVWLAAAGLVLARRRFSYWKPLLLSVLLWAAPLLAWACRNQARNGSYALDTHGGITLLIGTEYFDLNEQDTTVAMSALEKTPLYQEGQALPPAERDRLFTRRAFAYMREQPAETARHWVQKLINFWRFYPRADKAFSETATSRPSAGLGRGALLLISLLFEPWLILGGWWGFWALRRRWETLFPLALFSLGTMGVHMVSVSQMRYRLPVMPFLIFAAFAALAERRQAQQAERAR